MSKNGTNPTIGQPESEASSNGTSGGKLYGQKPMSEQERADFLAKARAEEAAYGPNNYVSAWDTQHFRTEHSLLIQNQALAGHTRNVEILKKDAELLSKTVDLKALSADVRSRLAAVWNMKAPPGMDDTRINPNSFEVMQDTASPKDTGKFREDLLALLNKRVEFEAKQVEIYQAKSNQGIATEAPSQAQTETTVTAQAAADANRQGSGIAWHKQPIYAGASSSAIYAEKTQEQLPK